MKLCPGQFESNTQKYIFVESVHTKLSAVQLSLMASIIYFVNQYSHFRNYAPPLDEKGGIITEKVFPVFSERVFRACFGLVI